MAELAVDLVRGADGLVRCGWAADHADHRAYHDDEWARPVESDDRAFEVLTLEALQSGLSWLTVLRKRETLRAAFGDFRLSFVARLGDADVDRLVADPGVIRSRAKIEATIANARAASELPGGLSAHLRRFAPADHPRPHALADVPARTPESEALSQDLRRRGFRYLGPTTSYALMQAIGVVDDHLVGCWCAPGEGPAG